MTDLELLEKTYLAVLQIDSCPWRIFNQKIYCELRDAIAEKTGKTSQEIQEKFQELADHAKYDMQIRILRLPAETRPSSALNFLKH